MEVCICVYTCIYIPQLYGEWFQKQRPFGNNEYTQHPDLGTPKYLTVINYKSLKNQEAMNPINRYINKWGEGKALASGSMPMWTGKWGENIRDGKFAFHNHHNKD